ncbi:MAG: penicillin acylase family protein [Alphaproteobacteria bacterium]|nr:penicillin acylase family protein [Alphaproteobacteria bacterium]
MLRRAAAGLLLLLIVFAAGFYLFLRSSLPQVEGRVVLRGLKAEIAIARDADGVPTISAADDEDAAFGLGFVHAQDRLFQMELQRRYGAGRLAEIFGAQAVETDKQMRVLGLYRTAEAAMPSLSAEVRRGLESYAAGVNAFLDGRRGALPPEFLILRFAPAPWRPADTLVWGKLMDFQLAGNYRVELLRARLARTVSAEDLAFLYPDYPKDAATTLAALQPIYRGLGLDRLYAALPAEAGPHYASNNWVVDGAHSASGRPLLANDPHLAFGAPGFWYLARLKTPQREIAGGTVAGTPLVVIGHNDRIAWGFTTTGSDVEDLFVEKIDPADPGRYVTPGGHAAFETRREQILVHDAPTVDLTVRTTRHGPVLSDILPPGSAEPGYVLALAAPFLAGEDRTAEALWNINRASDWAGFRDALRDFVGPQQNMVFAAADGTIGFIAPGRIPIRAKGDAWLPAPGWTGEYDWTGFVPFDELPAGSNPASGHFVSANNKIVPANYRYFLSRDWDLPNRAERIDELLASTPRQSPEASAAIQADTVSLMARRLVPLMTRIVPASDAARDAVERLRLWDFRMDAERVEPLLFTAWLRAFSRSVLFARLGEAAAAAYWDLKPRVIEAVLTERPDWCGDANAPAPASCETRLAATLDTALDELRGKYGPDIGQWQWGRAHVARFPNPVFSRVPVLRDWVSVAIPTPGAYDTVNRGPSSVRDDAAPYEQTFGAGLRIVTDLADPAGSRMITVPGQSGNPLSPHFSDLLLRWRRFDWLLPARAPAVATLTLVPAR